MFPPHALDAGAHREWLALLGVVGCGERSIEEARVAENAGGIVRCVCSRHDARAGGALQAVRREKRSEKKI